MLVQSNWRYLDPVSPATKTNRDREVKGIRMYMYICWYTYVHAHSNVSTIDQKVNHNPDNMMLLVGPTLRQCCQLCWANVGSTTLAHHLTALWAFVGPTYWANVGQCCLSHNDGRANIGPTLSFLLGQCWEHNVGHCLTALWTFIGPTGCLYGGVIIGPTLRRTCNITF